MPKIKHGNVEISAKILDIKGKLGLDLEFAGQDNTKVKFNSIVRQADAFFENLISTDGKMFIFIDELELSFANKNKYERDARMIRDLILAVEHINTLCFRKGIGIKVICGIRSEVLSTIISVGKEINKPITSFGVPILWHHPGGDIQQHPILDILLRRIMSSEKQYSMSSTNPKEIWRRWFPDRVQKIDTPQYILHHTWYRPRDIIRLLTLAQTQFPYNTNFDHMVFDSIRKQYSTDSWIEMTEELGTTYRAEQLEGIKLLLYGYKPYFTLSEIRERAESQIEVYEQVKILFDSVKISTIVMHLYRIGILGNITSTGKHRWVFRGDEEILLDQKIMVHRALWPCLSLFAN